MLNVLLCVILIHATASALPFDAPWAASAPVHASAPVQLFVSCPDLKTCQINGSAAAAAASVTYSPSYNATGWDVLDVTSYATAPDAEQAFAAGYGEGYVTAEKIGQHYRNLMALHFHHHNASHKHSHQKIIVFLEENLLFMRAQVAAHASTDALWAQVQLVLLQLDGLLLGYNAASSNGALTLLDLIVVNIEAEIGDITSAVDPLSRQPHAPGGTPLWAVLDGLKRSLHCSGVVHMTPDMTDVMVSHNTWSDYSCMIRVYKHYTLNFVHAPPRIVSFSSYPAELHSEDDFYITPHLIVFETTNMVFSRNTSFIQANSTLLTWMRAIVANTLAQNGSSWASIFKRYNSGTYNNQWVVVTPSIFHSRPSANSVPAGFVWILEQLPGYTEDGDVSDIVAQHGSWPSYNVPFFPTIRDMSGVEEMERQHGDYFSHSNCPRAQIFRRDLAGVRELQQLQKVMRSNDYTRDPLAHNNSEFQIAARFDLLDPATTNETSSCGGAFDAKVTSLSLHASRSALVVSGPTSGNVPVFSWASSPACAGHAHEGMPDTWAFDWVTTQPLPPARQS